MAEETRPRIKGLARAQRDAYVVQRRPARSLTVGAEEALFRHKSVLSEGSLRHSPATGERHYFGSTMITFDLAGLRKHWRGPFGAEQALELAELVRGSVRIKARCHRIACAEVARRVTDRPLGTAQVEILVRVSGDTLQLDVDLEVPVGVCSSARRAP
jgi:hypothetical protein